MSSERQSNADWGATRSVATPAPFEHSELTVDVRVAADAPRPEQRAALNGRYILVSLLGRGAMGLVYRAYDTTVAREVAVKVVRIPERQAQQRLIAEARAMAKLSDPHIVAVYDAVAVDGTDGDEVLLCMQCVEGQTLEQWLETRPGEGETLAVFRAAGLGLLAAHRGGIVHRDFKPANVLVGKDGRVLVTDFGVAASWSGNGSETASDDELVATSSRVAGTPWYMAPEQHLPQAVDPRADQYAFCVSLWEALTKESLFEDVNDAASLFVRKCNPPREWPRGGDVHPSIVRAIERGLSFRPEDRFDTMADLLAALREPETVSARLVSVGMRVAVGSVVLASGALGWMWQAGEAKRCTGAQNELVGVWSPVERDAVRSSFIATKVPYAPHAATQVEQALDRYAERWTTGFRDACESTTVAEEQPVSVMDLRMVCLRRAKVELRAAKDLLIRADEQVVERAQHILAGLPNLARCDDVDALQAEVMPPAPGDTELVEGIRTELAEIAMLRHAGKYEEALTRMQPLHERGLSVPHPPLRAELGYELGLAWENAGNAFAAEASYRQTLRSAVACKQWDLAVAAAVQLVLVQGYHRSRPHEGLAYAQTALGLMRLAGETSEPALRNSVGAVLQGLGRHADAEEEFRKAVRLAEELWGTHSAEAHPYQANFAVALEESGKLDEAEREQRAALETAIAILGPLHPGTTFSQISLAQVLFRRDEFAAAEALQRSALAALQTSLGNDHLYVAITRDALAKTLSVRGFYDEAEAEFTVALRALVSIVGPDHIFVALARSHFATALMGLERHMEAEEHLRVARTAALQTHAKNHPIVAEIQTNLARALLRRQRFAEAEIEARTAAGAWDSSATVRHPDAVHSLELLAAALQGQGRHEEAQIYLQRAAQMRADDG